MINEHLAIAGFLDEQALANARLELGKIPMYSTDGATRRCRSTCYGGFASVEPYEPMPSWLGDIRRRVELNAGVAYTHFNAVALVCLVVDSDYVDWRSALYERPHTARTAILTLDGIAHIELNSTPELRKPVLATAGQLVLASPGSAQRNRWRLKAAAEFGPSARKRKNLAEGQTSESWHLVFMHLLDHEHEELKRDTVHRMYKAFRYGMHLPDVLREPAFKLNLQVAIGCDTSKRQLLLDDMIPVKKERVVVIKEEKHQVKRERKHETPVKQEIDN